MSNKGRNNQVRPTTQPTAKVEPTQQTVSDQATPETETATTATAKVETAKVVPTPETNSIDSLVAKYQEKFLSVKQYTKNETIVKYRTDHANGGKLFDALTIAERYEIMKPYITNQEKKKPAPKGSNSNTETPVNIAKELRDQLATAPKGVKTRLINSTFKLLSDQEQTIKLDINQATLLVESLSNYITKDSSKDQTASAESLVKLSDLTDKLTKQLDAKVKQSKEQLIKEYEAKLKALKG